MTIFEKNLSALRRLHPEFLLPDEDHETADDTENTLEVVQAATGDPTAKSKGVFLHSKLDPRREARRFILQRAKGGCVVFFGFGLGYYVEEFLAVNRHGVAVVVEPDPALFRLALTVRDLTAMFESPGFNLVLDAEPDALTMVLNAFAHSTPIMAAPRSLVRLNEAYYQRLRAVIDSFISRREINNNTLNRFGGRWVRNLAANMPYLPAAHRLLSLEGTLQNTPALLLAAGPSLDSVVEYLPHLAKRFVLFAVDTSLRAVLRTGVTPDFLVIVDPQYWNFRHLDGCNTEGTILITESATYPAVLRRNYRAIIFGASLFPLGTTLERRLGRFGKLGAGGSVATSAWDAARQMGCSPIFAAGLDLGFPEGATHFKGGRFEDFALESSERYLPAETWSFAAINSAAPHPVPSNSGNTVMTDKRLVIYKWWFENQLKMHPDFRCGNLSRDGVKIEGMRYTSVTDLLDYPELLDPHPREKISFQMTADTVRQRREALRTSVTSLIAKLESLRVLAIQACELTRRIDDTGAIEQLNRIDESLLSHEAKEIAGFLLQGLAQQILDRTSENTTMEAIRNESTSMYESLRDSAEYHIRLLEAHVNRI